MTVTCVTECAFPFVFNITCVHTISSSKDNFMKRDIAPSTCDIN